MHHKIQLELQQYRSGPSDLGWCQCVAGQQIQVGKAEDARSGRSHQQVNREMTVEYPTGRIERPSGYDHPSDPLGAEPVEGLPIDRAESLI